MTHLTAETWDRLDLDQQRALVGLFVEHVVIRQGKRGRFFDPTRVQPVPVEPGAHEATTRRPEPRRLAAFEVQPWPGSRAAR
jgi:hypothetical protein